MHVDGDIQLSTNRDIHLGDSECEVGTHMGDIHILADDDIRLVPSNRIRISDFGSADWAVISPGLRTIGLGTTEPTEMLHLYTENDGEGVFTKLEAMHPTNWGEVGFRLETPDNRWHFRMDDDSHNNLNAGALGLRSQTGGIEVMAWEADGDVGVGTVHPTEKLDVNGNVRVRDGLNVEGALTAASLSGDYVGSGLDHTNITDEPGIASVMSTSGPSLGTDYEEVLSRTITVPSAGYVLALGSAVVALLHDASGSTKCYLGLTDGAAPWTETTPTYETSLSFNVDPGTYVSTVPCQKLFSVPSAGTYAYYMIARRSTDNPVWIYDSQMDLIFFTTVYASKTVAGGGIDVSEPNPLEFQSPTSTTQDELAAIKAELAALKARLSEVESMTGDAGN